MAPGVRRIPVRENGIIATLFFPPGDGPFPGTIISRFCWENREKNCSGI